MSLVLREVRLVLAVRTRWARATRGEDRAARTAVGALEALRRLEEQVGPFYLSL